MNNSSNNIDVDYANKYKDIMLVNLNCPIELASYKVQTSTVDKKVLIRINFINFSEQTVSAIKIKIFCFNAFDEPVPSEEYNFIEDIIQDIEAKPGTVFCYDRFIELKGFEETRRIKVIVTKVLFSNGNKWDYDIEDIFELNSKLVEGNELAQLIEVAGAGAICYPQIEYSYWQCICGKVNRNNAENCILCNRDKHILFNYCYDKEQVNKTKLILRKAKEEKLKKQKEQELILREKKAIEFAKKKKQITWIITRVVTPILLLFLGVAFYINMNKPEIAIGKDHNTELQTIIEETSFFETDDSVHAKILAKNPFGIGNEIKVTLVNIEGKTLQEVSKIVNRADSDLWFVKFEPIKIAGKYEVRFYINDRLQNKKELQIFYIPIYRD